MDERKQRTTERRLKIARRAIYSLAIGRTSVFGSPAESILDCLIIEEPGLVAPDLEGKSLLSKLRENIDRSRKN